MNGRKTILWCTGYYKLDGLKKKLAEIREQIKKGTDDYKEFQSAKIVNYIKDKDVNWELATFARIQLTYKE